MVDEDMKMYENLVYKLALDRYNKMHNTRKDVELDDVVGEAWWVYSWCLKNYQAGKGMKFSTYLYMQIRGRLADFYKIQSKPMNLYSDMNIMSEGEEKEYIETIPKDYSDHSKIGYEILEEAKEELSYEGYITLAYILSRKWQSRPTIRKPTPAALKKGTGYPPEVLQSILGEIKGYFKKKKFFQDFDLVA